MILAVAPTGWEVGCYFGEDRRSPLGISGGLQNAAKNIINADWQGGTVAGEEAADTINGASPNRTLASRSWNIRRSGRHMAAAASGADAPPGVERARGLEYHGVARPTPQLSSMRRNPPEAAHEKRRLQTG